MWVLRKKSITLKDFKIIKLREILNQHIKSAFISEWNLTKLTGK